MSTYPDDRPGGARRGDPGVPPAHADPLYQASGDPGVPASGQDPRGNRAVPSENSRGDRGGDPGVPVAGQDPWVDRGGDPGVPPSYSGAQSTPGTGHPTDRTDLTAERHGATRATTEPSRRVHTSGTNPDEDRSIGEIVSDLTRNFSTLVQQEVALAKAEAKQQVDRIGKGAGMFGGAAVTALMALTFLSLALWWWIAVSIGNHDHPALGWSGLIIGVLYAVLTGILAMVGKSHIKQVEPLPQTTDTVSKIPQALKGDETNPASISKENYR